MAVIASIVLDSSDALVGANASKKQARIAPVISFLVAIFSHR